MVSIITAKSSVFVNRCVIQKIEYIQVHSNIIGIAEKSPKLQNIFLIFAIISVIIDRMNIMSLPDISLDTTTTKASH